jgi:GNAT superfamily N-acetyltransferase
MEIEIYVDEEGLTCIGGDDIYVVRTSEKDLPPSSSSSVARGRTRVYCWSKGQEVPEDIKAMIKLAKELDGYNGYGMHFVLPIKTYVIYSLDENDGLRALGIGTQYAEDPGHHDRNDIWPFTDNRSRLLFIDYMWVHPDHRGEGYGSILLRKLESELHTANVSNATIYVISVDSAAPFYIKNGYLPIDIVKTGDDQEQLIAECQFTCDVGYMFANSLAKETQKELCWTHMIDLKLRSQYHSLVRDQSIPIELLIDVFERGIKHQVVLDSLIKFDACKNEIDLENIPRRLRIT